jgi:hypothetical protein
MEMNEPIAFADEKSNGPGQPILEILIVVFVKTAIQIHIAGTAIHIDGWNVSPGDDNEVSYLNLGATEYLPGNESGNLIALNASLDHDSGTGTFSLDEMYPQRILGILKKDVFSVL